MKLIWLESVWGAYSLHCGVPKQNRTLKIHLCANNDWIYFLLLLCIVCAICAIHWLYDGWWVRAASLLPLCCQHTHKYHASSQIVTSYHANALRTLSMTLQESNVQIMIHFIRLLCVVMSGFELWRIIIFIIMEQRHSIMKWDATDAHDTRCSRFTLVARLFYHKFMDIFTIRGQKWWAWSDAMQTNVMRFMTDIA